MNNQYIPCPTAPGTGCKHEQPVPTGGYDDAFCLMWDHVHIRHTSPGADAVLRVAAIMSLVEVKTR